MERRDQSLIREFFPIPPSSSHASRLPDGETRSTIGSKPEPQESPGAARLRFPKSPGVTAGHDAYPCGDADRGTDVRVGKAEPPAGHGVDVWRFDQAAVSAVAAEIPDTEVIGQDKDNVRLLGGGGVWQ